jgi:23S rRNA pseudouridine1911/1915/1917 synthase
MKKTASRQAPLLDLLAELFPDSSKTTLRQMLQNERVRVEGEIEKNARAIVDAGDTIEVGTKSVPTALPEGLSILHEDDDVIVVLKGNGLLTVATEREKETTAQAYLNEYLKKKNQGRIHVVHRLDRETSGVLVFAKTFEAREALKEQFAEHSTDRIYIAVIEGTLDPRDGTFESHLVEKRDLRMASVPSERADSKHAITHYRTIASKGAYSMLEVKLETGRKNQIRTHLSEAGHPIVGDRLYGSEQNPIGRLGLHAKLLAFTHPTTGERLSYTIPIPKAFRALFPG